LQLKDLLFREKTVPDAKGLPFCIRQRKTLITLDVSHAMRYHKARDQDI